MRDKGNKRYCAYAIQSKVTGRIYIGQTDCLERRFKSIIMRGLNPQDVKDLGSLLRLNFSSKSQRPDGLRVA